MSNNEVKKRILFVCTGNTCRSPMAEGIAKRVMETAEEKDLELQFLSAGVAAFPGMPASGQAIEVMEEQGIDIREHKARALTEQLLQEVDLVVTLTRNHRWQIVSNFPHFSDKVISFAGDVSDPFGGSKETYAKCAKEIEAQVQELLQKIKDFF